MQVLSVVSEVFPLIKTGGLADVAGALPGALAGHGARMRTLLPGYPAVTNKLEKVAVAHEFASLLGHEARLLAATAGGLDLLVLDAPALFDRPGGPYGTPGGGDFPDNWKRFAALSKAGAEVAAGALADWRPDLVHAHDWQAAMTPVYMRHSAAAHLPSVMTVHNLAFQGQFAADYFGQLELPASAFHLDGIEYYGGVGYLKGGLQSASAITTVSPTYAREIATPEFGMGLDGLIRARANDVHGIVNGIDTHVWNPQADSALAAAFGPSSLGVRAENRAELIRRFGLADSGGPLFVVISRLTWQKGMDLLVAATDAIVAGGGMLAVLGSGDGALEAGLKAAAERHPHSVGIDLGYNEALSHLMQGGGDAILVPSRFEPCGLTQLYGLRYGCVPVVAHTGGLADTVIDANEAALSAGVATGFQFAPVTVEAFRHALRRSFDAFAERRAWSRIQRQGMKADVSWDRSGRRYADLYRALIHKG